MGNKYAEFSRVEEKQADRLLWLASVSVPFGSLWWVPDSLWVQYARWYPGAKKRTKHPGLSIEGHKGLPLSLEAAPMLMGTSEKNGPGLAVKRLTPDQDVSHFSVRKYAPVPRGYFAGAQGANPTGGFVYRNRSKPSVTETEASELHQILNKRKPTLR